MKTALVVGGTSGIGLELARLLKSNHDTVIVTGRSDPKEAGLVFVWLSIDSGLEFVGAMEQLVDSCVFDTVVYNPGFYQEGNINELTEDQILTMVNVGLSGPALLMQQIMQRQRKLSYFAVVTSTSQLTPREREPMYCATKAALGMFAHALSLDRRIGRTLVAAPASTKTNFWRGTNRDLSVMLDPSWVARQIFESLFCEEAYVYSHILILRDPPRVKLVEVRC